MDHPLTIARPVEYLLSGIASTSSIITRFIRTVRVAHADLAAVTRDLSDLRLVLELLKEETGIPLALQGQMLLVLESCGNVLIRVDSVLAQCPRPEAWVKVGRGEIEVCREGLGGFREGLGLALDVVGVDGSSGSWYVETIREKIEAEGKRLREQQQTRRSWQQHDMTTLLIAYLDVLMSFLDGSPVELDSQQMLSAPVQDEAWPQGKQSVDLSYYTGESPPPACDRNPSPCLPESPTLPVFNDNPFYVSSKLITSPVIRPACKRSNSAVSVTNLEPESPTSVYSQDRSSPPRDGYVFRHSPVSSLSSELSRRSSSRISNLSAALGFFPTHKAAARLNSTESEPPGLGTPPPEYRQIWTASPRYPPPSIPTVWPEPPVRPREVVPEVPQPQPEARIEIVPKYHLTDKSKASEILHIDTSPLSHYIATKHSNKLVKIWSTHTNALHTTIKTTSYVQPRPRSREYFVQSHAILSEQNTLIGITTHFGLTLEIWDFAKPGASNAKKVQTIDEAHRWAASPRDAAHNNHAGLAVYRPKYDQIDCFFLSRQPGAKTPFYSDPNLAIELVKANLPFLPRFPELAYSSDPDNPILVAAAGPRPGDPPRANGTILVAWQLKTVASDKLIQFPTTAVRSVLSSSPPSDEDQHKPYRVCVPDHPALRTALPASLVVHGHTAVSVWIPASKSAAADTRHSANRGHNNNSPTSSNSNRNSKLTTPHRTFSLANFTKSRTAQKLHNRHHHQQHLSISTKPLISRPIPLISPQPPAGGPSPRETPNGSTTDDAVVPPRLLLLWDLPTNTTRLFPVPAHAQVAVSPDCGRLAYYDGGSSLGDGEGQGKGQLVVLDLKVDLGSDTGLDRGHGLGSETGIRHGIGTGSEAIRQRQGQATEERGVKLKELWRWPDHIGDNQIHNGLTQFGQFQSDQPNQPNQPQRTPTGLTHSTTNTTITNTATPGKSPTALSFSADGKTLLVGDTSGSVGVYGVEDRTEELNKHSLNSTDGGETGRTGRGVFELGVGNEIAWVDVL